METKPAFRKLRGYAFDPSFSSTIARRATNEVVYKINWEETDPGPKGEYIEVIDYDPTLECFYETVNLDDRYVMADLGMTPSEGDPRFHQQQVYAVSMSIIEVFEKALGRKIIWSRLVDRDAGAQTDYSHEFVPQLRIYPHAMRQQNAYYSPDKLALLFGYFQSAAQWNGNNIPGSAVFTCLSPDIVAHEITHAILDSLHPYLRKATNPDMPAFHEGFADIIALLHRFTFHSVVEEQIRNSRGDLLSPQNFLGDLAIQFGQAVSSHRRSLRSFLVEADEAGNMSLVTPDPSRYHRETEPHTRGALLVAAVFDAFVRLYKYRSADLIRLASGGTGVLAQGEIHPDLVKRLSREACDIAQKLMLICIRALDYCPPVDLTFGDYLQALITADLEHSPDDEDGLRYALLEGFRSWGIVPQKVVNYSVESLRWKRLDEFFLASPDLEKLQNAIRYIFDPERMSEHARRPSSFHNQVNRSLERILREDDRRAIFEESRRLSQIVHGMFDTKFEYNTARLEPFLGMSFAPIKYSLDRKGGPLQLSAAKRNKFQVYKCRPVFQYNAKTGKTSKSLIITFLQKVYVDLRDTPYEGYLKGGRYDFRGGATLVINLSDFEIQYAIVKRVTSASRLQDQLEYAINNHMDDDAALLMQGDEPFAALHIH